MSAGRHQFYLGKYYDNNKKEILDLPLLYDPEDLTTHAFITGMTGSGKTGLGIVLLEEAALQGLPAIIIDPKGDLTNLLLHFPELKPSDLQPWVNPDEARKENKDLEMFAQEVAAAWRKGHASWGIGSKELTALDTKVDYAIYTPGSTSGTSINILSSFNVPALDWKENSEILRERISSTVTGLLSLVGITEIDPLRSREHILLSNLIEDAWSKGESLDLIELILRIQNPPIDRLGAFPIERFFPEDNRFELAMLLNNFLAAPSFQTWLNGQSLNIEEILYGPNQKPRHSIFYLAHLSENERMFFVTLLFAAIETWMRAQRGTSSLRTLIYFDEILGYLPPVQNPPSRPLLLRMLKQARAFGVGLALATQNPVDLDYKALSNAGTWMIGRLQTENDKDRLLDGLMSSGAVRERIVFDRLISGLQKRVFILHNVHQPKPAIFHTRWALNYLAGPQTRSQIPALLSLKGQATHSEISGMRETPETLSTAPYTTTQSDGAEANEALEKLPGYTTQPAVPEGIEQYYLANNLGVREAMQALDIAGLATPEAILYRPSLFAQAHIQYYSKRYLVEYDQRMTATIQGVIDHFVRWGDFAANAVPREELQRQPQPSSRFEDLQEGLTDARQLKSLRMDYQDWAYRNGTIYLHANEKLNIYSSPKVTTAEFREMCSQAAREKWEEEEGKENMVYEKKIETLLYKISRQEREVESQEDEVGQRRMEEVGTHGELLLSVFSKRKRSVSRSLSKRRLTQQAKAELEEERKELEQYQKQLDRLEAEKATTLANIKEKWAEIATDITEVPLNPYKKDVYVENFGVLWLPYYLMRLENEMKVIPAYSSGKGT